MSDFKSLLKLTQEAQLRDAPFITTIKEEVTSLIDAAMLTETEYRVEYDINAVLETTDGPLQTTRIQNTILSLLLGKGYRATISTTEASPDNPMLVVTWTIATLTAS